MSVVRGEGGEGESGSVHELGRSMEMRELVMHTYAHTCNGGSVQCTAGSS